MCCRRYTEWYGQCANLWHLHWREIRVERVETGWWYSPCCCCSVANGVLTLRDPMDCSTPGSAVLRYLPEFAQTHVHWVGDAIQPSHPLSSLSPPAFSLSQHRSFPVSHLFTSGGQNIEASASASILINIQGWFPLGLTVLILQSKSLLQHHSLKASILWHSAFFMVQLSHLYVTTGKTIALTLWTFVGNVMSLLFITL